MRYYFKKWFSEKPISNRDEKSQSFYEPNSHKFWYDYIKATYDDKAQLCYIDTECFYL